MISPRLLPRAWRPREKLLRFGSASLTLEELWMCVLGAGQAGYPVHKAARDLATWQPDLTQESPPSQLGGSQKARVLAVMELHRRFEQRQRLQLMNAQDVLLLVPDLAQATQEKIFCFYCSSSVEVLHTEQIALGSLNVAIIQPRELFFPIRLYPVASIILCHNHPSGNPQPSREDEVFTDRVAAACELMGIELLDHIIVAKKGCFCFREEGLLRGAAG